MILVSSASVIGFDKVFVVGRRSFTYIMKARDLELMDDPWELLRVTNFMQ
jgi:hypothetical protein